jgi:selenium metabolism protein YedF
MYSSHGKERKMKVIDCRGLSCPQPVIETKKTLEGMREGIIEVIVDNIAAKENVSRFAGNQGCSVEVEEKGGNFHITIKKGNMPEKGKVEGEVSRVGEQGSKKQIVFLIASDQVGRGNEELGKTLMKSFLHTPTETTPKPETVIFMNSGVKLTIEGSPVLESLDKLEREGVNLLVCGTCLNYFEVKDKLKAGQVSNMYEIAETMLSAEKVIAP